MMFIMGPVLGHWFDCYGPRYLLLAGTFFHVFGIMMTSLAHEYYQFLLAQGLCSAFGASMIFYPAMSSLPTWFFRRRAFAFGLVASGSSMGGVIFPILVSHLIPQIGFGWSMRVCGFLVLGLMIIANVTVRSRMPRMSKRLSLAALARPLTELAFALTTIGSFFFMFGMYQPINFIILAARHAGMSARLAAYLVPIFSGASFFGRVLPGLVADRVGRYNTTIALCVFTALTVLALWLPSYAASSYGHANATSIAFAVLFGFGSGSFVSLTPSLVAQISPVKEIGLRSGTFFALLSFAALFSNPVGGALISADGGKYTGLQVFCGVALLVGTAIIYGARVVLAGPALKVKV